MEVSPTASRDATTAFIDTYRQLQGENTAQIGDAAHALGSDLTAQYGGLHGPSEYIKSRYQTPQTESRIAGLKSAAQLSALNQIMQNQENIWKNRYSKAQRNYQKRNYDSNKAAQAAMLGKIKSQAADEYSGTKDTMSISSNDDRFATKDKPRVTNVSANGGYYNGYPTVNTTIDNPNVVGDDELVGYYGPTGTANSGYTDADIVNQINTARGIINPFTRWPVILSQIFGAN